MLPVRRFQLSSRQVLLAFLLASFSTGLMLLSACSRGTGQIATVAVPLDMTGVVNGGQQPISNSSVQVYEVQANGAGGQAKALLTPTVTTDSNGNFSITGKYTCTSPNSLVYLVATGGNPGLPVGMDNLQITLMTVLGACNTLSSSTRVVIDEVTTVATIFALQPYMTAPDKVGYSGSSSAILGAFNEVKQLVDTSTGNAGGTGIPAGYDIPTEQMNTLANALAACVNSSGGSAGRTNGCGLLFTATGGNSTTDTATALLHIANNPSDNLAAIYALPTPNAPFQPMETTPPAQVEIAPLPKTVAPEISLASGSYSTAKDVTISDTTAGAKVYYTIDGTTPTTASTEYTGSIRIKSTTVLQAIAKADGHAKSDTLTATYTINLAPAATPNFTPPGGTYPSMQNVTIASSTSGAVIHYTINGNTPTASSPTYTTAISVSNTTTLRAIAISDDFADSAVASADYRINPAVAPTFSPAAGTFTATQSVTITSATSGATIYYTLDGSTPMVGSNTYAGPVAVNESSTLRAIAVKAGQSNSDVTTGVYTLNLPPAETPAFSVPAGTYTSIQTVSISSATSGAVIHYTLDGSTPTTSSPVFSGSLSIDVSKTVKAIATKTGNSLSAVATAAYVINLPPVETPMFSPGGGTYSAAQDVSISSATTGATIHYTTDGSVPSTASATYSGGTIHVASAQTLKAIAFKTGNSQSAVGVAAYTINLPAAAMPMFSPAGGTYTTDQTVSLTSATPGSVIYFTTNGSIPTTSSTLYSGPFSVTSFQKVQAIAVATDFSNSPVSSSTYAINYPAAATPLFSPGGGTYAAYQSVSIASSTPDAAIRYTMDGTTPTSNSPLYAGPISVKSTQTLKAIALHAGNTTSAVGAATYTINLPAAATPIFSPGTGTYPTVQTVTISSSTAGATIYYTTDGSTPTTSSAVYGAPLTVGVSATLKAIAVADAKSNSAVGSASYMLNLPTATTPSLSEAGGTFFVAQTVSLSTTTTDGSIYYTLDGSTPTTASALYTGPITISSTHTLSAVTAKANYNTSPVVSATYSIKQGTATVFAGNGTAGYTNAAESGGNASFAEIHGPYGMTVVPGGSVYFTDSDFSTLRIRAVSAAGILKNDLAAPFSILAQTLASDTSGNLYFYDINKNCIFKATQAGNVAVYAGKANTTSFGDPYGCASGTLGFSGPATQASLGQVNSLALDAAGNLYIGQTGALLKVTKATGNISLIAGNPSSGSFTYSGEGSATSSNLGQIRGLAIDSGGNVYLSDYTNNRVRKVTTGGIISTVVGNGTAAQGGNFVTAQGSPLFNPEGLAMDTSGNLFIAEVGRVRRVDSSGVISTFASQTGGNVSVNLSFPSSLSFDSSGSLFIGDVHAYEIFKISFTQ